MAEFRGFAFSVIFIIIFAGLLVSVPSDLQGQSEEPEILTPLDPSLVAGFAETEEWNTTDLNPTDQYFYTLNARDWSFAYYGGTVQLGAKVYIGPFWFGQLDSVEFFNTGGVNRGGYLSSTEIDADATNGTATYDIRYITTGADVGGFIIYWNSTEYASSSGAYVGDEVYFLHGVGVGSNAVADVGSLLIGLLFLQLPECPTLINLLLATPLYAAVTFLLWFLIKETLPFV